MSERCRNKREKSDREREGGRTDLREHEEGDGAAYPWLITSRLLYLTEVRDIHVIK